MASLIAWLKYSGARKSDGTPVASGRAFFYQPGTTSTQIQVYSDVDGLVGLTQPVALDAAGRATVYAKLVPRIEVQEAVTNTVVGLSDRGHSLNAAQVEVENVNFSGTDLVLGTQVAGGRTDLDTILSSMATGGSYKESPAAQFRDLNDAVGLWITPQDFGAVGDGLTDDTTAWGLTIARAMVANKGIFIPSGTYLISSALTVTGATGVGLVIRGANRATCILKNLSTTANVLTVDLSSAIDSQIVLENFSITANTVSSGAAISFLNGDAADLRGLVVAQHRIGFELSAVWDTQLDRCVVVTTDSNAAGKGFRLGPRSMAERCRVLAATNGTGFSLEGSDARVFQGRAAVTTGTGYLLSGAGSHAVACLATSCTLGFSLTGASTRALLSGTTDTPTGFSLAGANAQAQTCSAFTSGGTTGFSLAGVSAQVRASIATGFTTGFSLTAATARAHSCQSVTCTTGYYLFTTNTVAHACTAVTSTHGFTVSAAAGAGCIACISTDGSTDDFLCHASATSVVDSGNTFTTRSATDGGGNAWLGQRMRVLKKYKSLSSVDANFTWTPSIAEGELHVLVWTSVGTTNRTLTVNTATAADLKDGQQMTIVIANYTTTGGGASLTVDFPTANSWTHTLALPIILQYDYAVWRFVWAINTQSRWMITDFINPCGLTSGGFWV